MSTDALDAISQQEYISGLYEASFQLDNASIDLENTRKNMTLVKIALFGKEYIPYEYADSHPIDSKQFKSLDRKIECLEDQCYNIRCAVGRVMDAIKDGYSDNQVLESTIKRLKNNSNIISMVSRVCSESSKELLEKAEQGAKES